jgi:hypothetical protein
MRVRSERPVRWKRGRCPEPMKRAVGMERRMGKEMQRGVRDKRKDQP